MAKTREKRIPKVLQAIIEEAHLYIERGVAWRGDWKGDTYPRYYKQGGIQVKSKPK